MKVTHSVYMHQFPSFVAKGFEMGGKYVDEHREIWWSSDNTPIFTVAFEFKDEKKGDEYYEWGIKNNKRT